MRKTLKAMRAKNGWDQKDVAAMMGVSTATYSMIESGARFGSAKSWEKLKDIYKIKNADIWRIQHEE